MKKADELFDGSNAHLLDGSAVDPSGYVVDCATAKDCEYHCMHSTGAILCSMPPQIELVCCKCGHKDYIRCAPPTQADQKNHGPFLPNSRVDGLKITT